jgi:uncharacterized secreted protein with C-terminal beta-propeller domain
MVIGYFYWLTPKVTASGVNLHHSVKHEFKTFNALPTVANKNELISLLKERTKNKASFLKMEQNEGTDAVSSQDSASAKHSTTNNQVAGVDEGDKINTCIF